MSLAAFILSVVVLLATPGPTNTMLALAGAEQPLRKASGLLPFELAGYLVVVTPLALLAPLIAGHHPSAALVMKTVAAVWLLVLGTRLWFAGKQIDTLTRVTARMVFVTTLLNPKALIFGLVLVPAGAVDATLLRLALFAGLVLAIGGLWVVAGHTLQRSALAGRGQAVIRRVAAVALLLFSATLAGSALASGFSS